ncbi:hypothetical protein B0I35DRAFT_102653 [Stachybotrys elegans]|uniref:Uncharacterized protein n=1 Tax=Stachybotrys elegans TaxID=80388 RepID=A0A8K0WKS8_9HYPO|nr:hypothetical protein B0I35DRAFT_102653 [Stachybotrys elegans]
MGCVCTGSTDCLKTDGKTARSSCNLAETWRNPTGPSPPTHPTICPRIGLPVEARGSEEWEGAVPSASPRPGLACPVVVYRTNAPRLEVGGWRHGAPQGPGTLSSGRQWTGQHTQPERPVVNAPAPRPPRSRTRNGPELTKRLPSHPHWAWPQRAGLGGFGRLR